MLKLMIVDDDENIRDRVSGILSGMEEIEIVAQAEDGDSALEQYIRNSPNIVILDINIPGKSGLEVAESIAAMDADARIIIITGFQEFTYAQQALKLGICDFLTKPVNSLELKGAVKNAVNYFSKLREQKLSREKLNELLEESLPILKERFLESLLQGEKKRDESWFYRMASKLGIRLNDSKIVVSIIEPHFSEKNMEDVEKNILHIKNIFEEILQKAGFSYQFYFDGLYRAIALIELSEDKSVQSLEQTLAGIADKVKFYLGIQICNTIGVVADRLSELQDSYKTAIEALQYQHLFAQNSVVNYKNIIHMQYTENTSYKADMDSVIQSIRIDAEEQVINKYNIFIKKVISSSGGNRKYVRKYLLELMAAICLVTPETGYEIDLEAICRKIFLTDDILALSRFVGDICRDIVSEMQKKRNSRSGFLIELAKRYIENNYADHEINLQEVSEKIGLSEKYFCQLFMKAEGIGFIDFVNRKRMEMAKELLKTTPLKVYEVADKVGFLNVKYFNVLFKKNTGLTPQEFRGAVSKFGC